MNEYTRRGETLWILVSAMALVGSVGGALALLLTAQGPLVPDRAAQAKAIEAGERAKVVSACEGPARRLEEERGVLRGLADAAALQDEAPPPPPDPRKWQPKPKPKPKPAVELAWAGVRPTHDLARTLEACRAGVVALVEPPAEAVPGWTAIAATAAVAPPPEGDADAQRAAAKKLFAAIDGAPLEAVIAHVGEASSKAALSAVELADLAGKAQVREPLPKGLLGREAAIAVGVLGSLLALLVSFFSLRAASLRRASSLAGLRALGRGPERGRQAAGILRIAAEPDAGEPGLVIGAALGGLLSAALLRSDADFYVAGVLAGILAGLGVQALLRRVSRGEGFRERALALAELEKPTVPVVLVLGTIQHGLERDFLDFMLNLPEEEAGRAVEKLATQAEEQILAAADAQAMR